MTNPLRYYRESHLHFLTTSTYRRARLFDSLRFKEHFIHTLDELRKKMRFRLIGYVLMPEHFHLLIWPVGAADPSKIMASLKERTAKFMIKNLKLHHEYAWCEKMLKIIELPASVHDEASYRVWQRRFFDSNIWSEKKRLEKLNYMHANPVKRKLVEKPGDWPWLSWQYFHSVSESKISLDRLA